MSDGPSWGEREGVRVRAGGGGGGGGRQRHREREREREDIEFVIEVKIIQVGHKSCICKCTGVFNVHLHVCVQQTSRL